MPLRPRGAARRNIRRGMEHLTLGWKRYEDDDSTTRREESTLPIFVLSLHTRKPRVHPLVKFTWFIFSVVSGVIPPPSPPPYTLTRVRLSIHGRRRPCHSSPWYIQALGFLWEIIHPLAGFGADTCFIRRMNDVSCSPVSCHFWYEAEPGYNNGIWLWMCIYICVYRVEREVLGHHGVARKRFFISSLLLLRELYRCNNRLLIVDKRKWMDGWMDEWEKPRKSSDLLREIDRFGNRGCIIYWRFVKYLEILIGRGLMLFWKFVRNIYICTYFCRVAWRLVVIFKEIQNIMTQLGFYFLYSKLNFRIIVRLRYEFRIFFFLIFL